MPTNNSINSGIPIEITKGGTLKSSFVSNATIAAGTTGTGALQDTGPSNAAEVLTSQGAGSKALFTLLPTFFTVMASDPVSPSPGDTWYNSTSDTFKGCVSSGAGNVWVVKASTLAVHQQGAGSGTGSAGYIFGGNNPSTNTTEFYDGGLDTWTSKGNLTFARNNCGASGSSSSDALCFGGVTGTLPSNRYNGGTNTWSNVQRLITQRTYPGGSGTAASALSYGGYTVGVGTPNAVVEQYNGGTNIWSSRNGMNVVRGAPQGAGTTLDTLAQGGVNGSNIAQSSSERYDGNLNSWTVKASASVIRCFGAAAGANGGDMMIYGGQDNVGPTVYSSTELYNGVGDSWSTIASLNVARYTLIGQGTTSDALASTGRTSVPTTTNERFQGTVATIVTFTVT